jgi:hypothetical protein
MEEGLRAFERHGQLILDQLAVIGNRAGFLYTKAPMLRIPETNFLQGITSIRGEMFRRSAAAATTVAPLSI